MKSSFMRSTSSVAPRVGAWIETQPRAGTIQDIIGSHPEWVRGLKPAKYLVVPDFLRVAPRVGAWIET